MVDGARTGEESTAGIGEEGAGEKAAGEHTWGGGGWEGLCDGTPR